MFFYVTSKDSVQRGISATLKGPAYFSGSFYIKNQKPMIPRTDFHCTTTRVTCFLGEIQQCICVFCNSVFASQMVL